MLYAYDKNYQRISATPQQRAICPYCKGGMIAKCGEINIWHWAHIADYRCDAWQETESLWHLMYKKYFDPKNVEVIISKNGEKHIADIQTNSGLIIELQHSYLSPSDILKRETFYGNLVWLFDVRKSSERIDFRAHDPYTTFRWKHPKKHIATAKKPVYLDVFEDDNWEFMFWLKKMYMETPCGGWGYWRRREILFSN